ncbi:MAG: DUF4881 domain-containing protein [Thermodesulfovibrio sp.]|nr:DUF4881 domain-containing protein [Thermodesulfovibrio sp.]MCX7724480.1 DUF4881 domain-containing protein [Thermodesulfovibrio sp.]MDW7971675.1 DUF4881 domain-containing protein [Thermodesulfovibrio sp.]
MALSWKHATGIEKVLYIYFILSFVVAIVALLALHPKEFGQVDQGRVIAYDKQKGLVTIISDSRQDAKNPDYNTLPPRVYKIPENPSNMGPEPTPGKRMKLDLEKNIIVIFDDATQNFLNIPIEVVDKKLNIRRDNPLVAGKKFPIIDKEKRTITVYSARQQLLATFKVPEEHINRPPETWIAGDEVRIYYREPGKAHKFMNITKTDIYKK